MIDKEKLRVQILNKLEADYNLLLEAAKSSHLAATHEDNIPDSKYETLALEASYIAQGQANRAQEIKLAMTAFQKLEMLSFSEQSQIRLSALVILADENGRQKSVFIGPAAGGLKLDYQGLEVMLITPDSPLGRELIGSQLDDSITVEGGMPREYEIIEIA